MPVLRTARDYDAMKQELLRCPQMQTLSHARRLREAPRKVQDHVFLWHGQLRVAGLTDVDYFDGNEELVYAIGWPHNGSPVLGALMWRTQQDGSWWTELGWVEPIARREGLYSMLWEHCVYLAREAHVPRIWGGTHVSNQPMRCTMEKLGRKPQFLLYEYEVTDG